MKQNRPRIPFLILYFTIVIIGCTALFFLSIMMGCWGAIPTNKELSAIKQQEASLIFSEDGEIMGKYYLLNRTSIPFDSISSNVINALLATEDKRFYKHNGIDKKSLIRVLLKTLLLGDRSSGGGSTISQQLAKNLYPRYEQEFQWMPIVKVKEMIMAIRLEEVYSKEEILTLYLNTVSFGDGIFGIETAAQQYFDTSANDLTIEDAATLIGILNANTRYNPRLNNEKSRQRRNIVLGRMKEQRYITPIASDSLQLLPLTLNYNSSAQYAGMAPYYRNYIKKEVLELVTTYNQENGTNYNLFTDGLRITTSINSHLQNNAEKAVTLHIQRLQKEFDEQWKSYSYRKEREQIMNNVIHDSEIYNALKKEGLNESAILKRMRKKKKMVVYVPSEGNVIKEWSSIDSLDHYTSMLNPGMIVVSPRSGKILAWVGGTNYQYLPFDQVTAARQVGSIFKPVIYGAAIHYGKTTPSKYYKNEQITYTDYDYWTPRNSNNDYSGYYTLKGALSKSINTIAVQVLMDTGIDETIDYARELGISSYLPRYPSLALGVASIPLLEIVRPYIVFANEGRSVAIHSILEIADSQGNCLYKAPDVISKQVITEEESSIMTDMLMATTNEGTAKSLRNAYHLKNDIASKTGTTQHHADGWFVGYTPNMVVGVRVGANNPSVHFQTITQGQGAYMALPIFARFMQYTLNTPNYKSWQQSTFPLYLPTEYNTEIPNFKEHLNLMDRLKPLKEQLTTIPPSQRETRASKKSFFKRLKGIFRRE